MLLYGIINYGPCTAKHDTKGCKQPVIVVKPINQRPEMVVSSTLETGMIGYPIWLTTLTTQLESVDNSGISDTETTGT